MGPMASSTEAYETEDSSLEIPSTPWCKGDKRSTINYTSLISLGIWDQANWAGLGKGKG